MTRLPKSPGQANFSLLILPTTPILELCQVSILASSWVWGPSGAGIWSAPTIDAGRGVVYAATGNTYTPPQLDTSDAVIAFDLKTGKIKWTQQVTPKDIFGGWCRSGSTDPHCPGEVGPDFDFGNAPILTKLPSGKDLIVIGQKSGVGWALDPDKQRAVVWQYRAGVGSAGRHGMGLGSRR